MEKITLPVSAIKHLREIDTQIMNLKYQADQFLNGIFIGMGIEPDKVNIKMNFEDFTAEISEIPNIEDVVEVVD